MAKVTIVGSHSNKNTSLPPGVVVTVERTPEVSKLISRGYAHVVPDAAPPVVVELESAEPASDPEPVKSKRSRRAVVELPDEASDG